MRTLGLALILAALGQVLCVHEAVALEQSKAKASEVLQEAVWRAHFVERLGRDPALLAESVLNRESSTAFNRGSAAIRDWYPSSGTRAVDSHFMNAVRKELAIIPASASLDRGAIGVAVEGALLRNPELLPTAVTSAWELARTKPMESVDSMMGVLSPESKAMFERLIPAGQRSELGYIAALAATSYASFSGRANTVLTDSVGAATERLTAGREGAINQAHRDVTSLYTAFQVTATLARFVDPKLAQNIAAMSKPVMTIYTEGASMIAAGAISATGVGAIAIAALSIADSFGKKDDSNEQLMAFMQAVLQSLSEVLKQVAELRSEVASVHAEVSALRYQVDLLSRSQAAGFESILSEITRLSSQIEQLAKSQQAGLQGVLRYDLDKEIALLADYSSDRARGESVDRRAVRDRLVAIKTFASTTVTQPPFTGYQSLDESWEGTISTGRTLSSEEAWLHLNAAKDVRYRTKNPIHSAAFIDGVWGFVDSAIALKEFAGDTSAEIDAMCSVARSVCSDRVRIRVATPAILREYSQVARDLNDAINRFLTPYREVTAQTGHYSAHPGYQVPEGNVQFIKMLGDHTRDLVVANEIYPVGASSPNCMIWRRVVRPRIQTDGGIEAPQYSIDPVFNIPIVDKSVSENSRDRLTHAVHLQGSEPRAIEVIGAKRRCLDVPVGDADLHTFVETPAERAKWFVVSDDAKIWNPDEAGNRAARKALSEQLFDERRTDAFILGVLPWEGGKSEFTDTGGEKVFVRHVSTGFGSEAEYRFGGCIFWRHGFGWGEKALQMFPGLNPKSVALATEFRMACADWPEVINAEANGESIFSYVEGHSFLREEPLYPSTVSELWEQDSGGWLGRSVSSPGWRELSTDSNEDRQPERLGAFRNVLASRNRQLSDEMIVAWANAIRSKDSGLKSLLDRLDHLAPIAGAAYAANYQQCENRVEVEHLTSDDAELLRAPQSRSNVWWALPGHALEIAASSDELLELNERLVVAHKESSRLASSADAWKSSCAFESGLEVVFQLLSGAAEREGLAPRSCECELDVAPRSLQSGSH
ncbi:hypothetical protein [Pseudoxanthomonas spadix]|uniref:hypothetical protein n=1 Tax=Pseudoxanthomonas spadix TaxID=415229 RepID=UPI000307AE14|nr:hypothetical protein [Pseudoxanthomonas spadix]